MATMHVITSANTISVTRLAERPEVPEAGLPSGQYLIESVEDVGQIPTPVLLAAVNKVRGTRPIKGWHTRTKANAAGWEALNVLAGNGGREVELADASAAPEATTQEGTTMAATATKTRSKAKSAAKGKGTKTTKNKGGKGATNGATRYRLIDLEPAAKRKEDIKPARAGSKTATMIDMLAEGATLPALEKALSERGKPVNARAWVTGFGRFGYGVKAVDAKAELPTYRLVYPAGMRQPLAHRTPKSGDEE